MAVTGRYYFAYAVDDSSEVAILFDFAELQIWMSDAKTAQFWAFEASPKKVFFA